MSTSICMEMLASDSSSSSGLELLKAERRNREVGNQGRLCSLPMQLYPLLWR